MPPTVFGAAIREIAIVVATNSRPYGIYANSVGEDSISSRPDIKLLFPLFYQIPQFFFFF